METTLPTTPRLALLTEDPDLAIGVPATERAVAERTVTVPRLETRPGPLDLAELVEEPMLGVLILRGFVGISVAIGDRAVEQVLGPGDVIQPLTIADDSIPATFTHRTVEPARLAVLDQRFIAAARHWPGLLLALHERLRAQERQLFIHAAASKQRRAEDRVLAALWQLADQWGSVTTDGILLPFTLSHVMLGRLSGASRPTVSLALAALAVDGQLHRNDQGRMVLAPESWRALDPQRATAPRPARQRVPGSPDRSSRLRSSDHDALRERVAVLHAGFERRVRHVDDTLAAAKRVSRRSAEMRARLRVARAGELSLAPARPDDEPG